MVSQRESGSEYGEPFRRSDVVAARGTCSNQSGGWVEGWYSTRSLIRQTMKVLHFCFRYRRTKLYLTNLFNRSSSCRAVACSRNLSRPYWSQSGVGCATFRTWQSSLLLHSSILRPSQPFGAFIALTNSLPLSARSTLR